MTKKSGAAGPRGAEPGKEIGDSARLLHELQVYEVELEHQNVELRLARDDLEAAVARYAKLYDFAPVGYFTLKRDGSIAQVNRAGADLLGLPRPEVAGKRLANYVAGGHRAAFDLFLARVVLSDENQVGEVALKQAEGEPLFVRIEGRLAEGREEYLLAVADISERKATEAQLATANERLASLAAERANHLRELASELIRAEQRERDRLYELLHDNMQPLLVAARFSLSGISPRTPPETCMRIAAEARDHITRVLDTARNLSLQLNPPLIREQGLGAAIASLASWVHANHGLTVELACAPEAEPAEVEIRLLCFNAVRELLMNAVKHAATDRVKVELQRENPETLRITVADQGSGFDPAEMHGARAARGGTGLLNIERRLAMVGGQLLVHSAPSRGTTATLLAPTGPRQPKVPAGHERRQGAERRRGGRSE